LLRSEQKLSRSMMVHQMRRASAKHLCSDAANDSLRLLYSQQQVSMFANIYKETLHTKLPRFTQSHTTGHAVCMHFMCS
jgi:hypothetical protein